MAAEKLNHHPDWSNVWNRVTVELTTHDAEAAEQSRAMMERQVDQMVRLVDDLRASRRRIVAAQDERAKKLERNIHDGAQQQLVAGDLRIHGVLPQCGNEQLAPAHRPEF